MATTFVVPFNDAAHAKSVTKDFAEAWEHRRERYQKEQKAADEAVVQSVTALAEARNAGGDLNAPINAVFQRAIVAGEKSGKVVALQRLEHFMREKPSSVRAQLWLEEQVAQVQDVMAIAQAEFQTAKELEFAPDGSNFGNVVAAGMTAINRVAFANGAAAELASIDSNLSLYYQAKGQQDAQRRAKRAAILQALSQTAQNYQNSLNSGWSATCRTNTFGMTTTTQCSGN